MSSWMNRYLPKFWGTIGEDPVEHEQMFYSICSRMKPKDNSLEGFMLNCFEFSLTDSALSWYYSSYADYESCYGDLRAKFLKEFSLSNYGTDPCQRAQPSFRLEVRKKISTLKQSRDETLDEYLSYFDSIVARCPYHGFTNYYLLQRFLDGMMPHERNILDAAAGGSVMKLTMNDLWNLINDMAESSKRGSMLQTDDKAPTVETDPVQVVEDITYDTSVTILPTAMPNPEGDIDTWAVVEAAQKESAYRINEMLDTKPRINEEELNSDYPGHLEENGPLAPKEEPAEPLKPVLTAELTKADPALSVITPGDLMNDEDEDPWLPEEELHSDYPWELEEELPKSGPVLITNLPKEVPALLDEPTEVPVLTKEAPKEVPDFTAKPAETCPDLTVKLTEKITAGPVLTEELLEKDPVLMAEKPLLNPSCSMQITATKDEMIDNDAVLVELEEKHEPRKPTKELSLVTSQEEPPEKCKDQGRPFISAIKKRIGMGTSLKSPMFDGKIPSFQNCKGANRSNMKKRPRHGTFEWRPGWRNTRARLDGPAAMVKSSSPSRKHVKDRLPEQWRTKPSTSLHEFFGQIDESAEGKFDLTRPWDPDPS